MEAGYTAQLNLEEDFEQFYVQVFPMIRALVFRMVGLDSMEDVMQESFLRLWRARKNFRGEANPRSWMYRIALSAVMDHLRSKKKTPRYFEDSEKIPTDGNQAQVENHQLLFKAMATLTEDHRAILSLFYFQDLDLKAVSEVLSLPEGTVKSRLHYAKKALLERFERIGVRL